MKWKTKGLDLLAIIVILVGVGLAVLSLETPKKTVTTVTEQMRQTAEEQINANSEEKQESKSEENKEAAAQPSEAASTSSPDSKTVQANTSAPAKETKTSKTTTSSAPAATTNTTQPAANQEAAAPKEEPKQKVVYVSVKGYDGFSVGKTEVPFKEGATAFTVLKDLADLKKFSLDYMGSGRFLYVQGINGQMEKDKGALSGWIYTVNGNNSNKSAGDFDIKEGDVIEWIYKES
ncbi:DUF4430 domain-containing protein [Bacillus sp. T33-2]|uniref:DUF4430 domain-containing protein n=1 Tax=Bacillus sp. T33-2 TaxID=2054168 RepID=UPI000C79042C|nr:DUF4430 domain-containing protein [Bacillus sp. T33-2]PLR96884.1 hypothetical protein CVD19_09845 [Bacillus sp. T33-2]